VAARPGPPVTGTPPERVTQVIRGICWLPPGAADTQADTYASGTYERTIKVTRVLGRAGWLVLTESWDKPAAQEAAADG